ncbi:diguanylate cyclase [Comamonas guangdongensis]|uniref:GGDEF domain-containing protein n=1 Tax=Comamonas guangdongensis TaxID=510515 RepID=UPI003F6DD062
MSANDDYILVLAPSLSLLSLAAILGVCWFVQRQQRFLLWLCSAFTLTAVSLGIRSLLPFELLNHHVVAVSALYLLGAWCLAMGFAERRNASTHPKLALLTSLITLVAVFYFTGINLYLPGRLHAFGLGIAVILLLPVSDVLRHERSKDWLDQTLLWSYVAYAVFTMLRPLLVSIFGPAGLGDAMHPNSAYWETTLISVTLYALLITVLLCAITIRATIDQLRDERDHDALTQILNRRAFHEAAKRRLADQRLYPMAVLAGDIDHFKRINDNWGHDRGDQVLQLVSSIFQRHVRSQDLVARFGGEEFVLLLTRIDLLGAERLAQRIRLELSSDNTTLPPGARLTISFGIAAITAPHQLAEALKEADGLLYSAKKSGRDRVYLPDRMYPDICFQNTVPQDSSAASHF